MNTNAAKNHNSPLVTIIITTKNEEKNIGDCLESIKKQSYPQNNIEIIVVDNNSSDRTKKIALQYTDKVYNYGPERSAQRNFGVEKSRGEYILYLDADMILSPTVVEECVNKFLIYNLKFSISNKQLVALYIPEIVTGDSFWSKVRRFERSFYNATVIDCVRFIRKKDFTAVSGFDESMSGPEDWDFDKKIRLRGNTSIITSPIYHNEAQFNLHKYLNKKAYYSKSFKKYIGKWGKDDPDIAKQFGVLYRFFFVFVEKGKWKSLMKHPILTFAMFFLRIMVGIEYLLVKILYNRKTTKIY